MAASKPVKQPEVPAVYVEYVKGASIADIAAKHDMAAQDVLDVIAEVERNRTK